MPVRTWQGHLLLSMLSLSGCTLCSSVIAIAIDGHCCCLHLSQVQCVDQTDFAICPCLGKPCYACFGDCLLLAMQAHQELSNSSNVTDIQEGGCSTFCSVFCTTASVSAALFPAGSEPPHACVHHGQLSAAHVSCCTAFT